MSLTEHYIITTARWLLFSGGSVETADTFLSTGLLLLDTFLEKQDSRELLKCVVGVLTFLGPVQFLLSLALVIDHNHLSWIY